MTGGKYKKTAVGRRIVTVGATLLAGLAGLFSGATGAQTNPSGVTATRLPNGLLVLTKEVHAAPVVCTYVWYRVGSRYETPGVTGVSHQLEHMMFKGTKKAFPNPGYIDLLVGRYGGENNASTDTDATAYYLLLPSSQLDLALRIEADRMTQAAIDPKQLTAEKTVVLSELEGDENNNAFYLYENTRAAAYQYHPYHYPVIGTKWDVQHFTRQQVYDYYRAHYAPDNATMVIVGDFDTASVLAKVRTLWKDVAPSHFARPALNPEPAQRGERRVVVKRAGAVPYVEMMYHIPAATDPDLPALTVLATALTSGRSSRLYRALVETQLATSVSASANLGVDPEVFDVSLTARAGSAPDAAEKATLAEIERVRTGPLDDQELQKARNQTRADFVFAQDSVIEQASRLGYFETQTGDWRNVNTYLARINAVTAADVQRVAQKYLAADNRTVGTFLPTGDATPPGADSGGATRAANYKAKGQAADKTLAAAQNSPAHKLPTRVGAGTGQAKRKKTTALSSSGRAKPDEGAPISSLDRAGQNANAAASSGAKVVTTARKLANGLTVIVRENHANPTITIGGFVRAGSVNDPAGKFGLASLTADMLTRGTTTRTSQQIANETDFVGARLGVGAGRERTDFSAAMLTENFDSILGLLADVLRNPAFPAEELEKARGEALSGLQEAANSTSDVATKGLYAALYANDNPFQHAPDGRAEDVKAISRDDLAAFYKRVYRPEATTIIVVGDVKTEAALTAITKALGDWKGQGDPASAYEPKLLTPATTAPPPAVVVLPDKSQDDVAMGVIGLSRSAPDYEAASLMNLILGGDQFVGRVGKRVRDTEGLAYYAYTGFSPGLETGPFVFRAGVNPQNVPHAIASAKDEIGKMAKAGVTTDELAWAKDHSIGALGLSLATNGGMVGSLENAAFYGLGLDYAERYPNIVRALTKAQVDAAAQKYLRPEALAVVVAGPPVPALVKPSSP